MIDIPTAIAIVCTGVFMYYLGKYIDKINNKK